MNYYYGNYAVINEYQFVVEVNDNNISIARVCYVMYHVLIVSSQISKYLFSSGSFVLQ